MFNYLLSKQTKGVLEANKYQQDYLNDIITKDNRSFMIPTYPKKKPTFRRFTDFVFLEFTATGTVPIFTAFPFKLTIKNNCQFLPQKNAAKVSNKVELCRFKYVLSCV